MEHYIKKMSFLGENIQTIRKHRKMKQQELADAIGINMQSLSKIERGVNYPVGGMGIYRPHRAVHHGSYQTGTGF